MSTAKSRPFAVVNLALLALALLYVALAWWASSWRARGARVALDVDINKLMLAIAVMMFATAIAVGVAKKLELGSIVALLVVGMALGPHSPIPLLTRTPKRSRFTFSRSIPESRIALFVAPIAR